MELVLANNSAVLDIAVVVAAPGSRLTLEALREFGQERLARYKLPRHLVVVDELARNVTGKMSRDRLREMYCPRPNNV